MKNRSGLATRLSLAWMVPIPVPAPPALKLIRPDEPEQTTFIQHDKISNDSQYWDHEWFNHYE
jgi:hypothetical protein